MKSLRQLLRRRLHSSRVEGSPKRRATKHHGGKKRRLSTQTLEQRQLLAGDLNIAHNYWNGYDVNEDRQISPSDALGVINYLAANTASGEQVEGNPADAFAGKKVDVNSDGHVTPSDALSVINAIARGEQMDPLVEFFLTARDFDDNLLPVNNGVVQAPGTGIENRFFLEVSYSDLRTLGDDLGAFTIFPDIGVSQGGILQPVLRETQQIIIGEEIRDTTSGSVFLTREGNAQTFEITRDQIFGSQGFAGALSDLLVNEFGLSTSDFRISQPPQLKGENGRDLGFQIAYTADSFGNVDIPDFSLTSSFDIAVPVTFNEFAPFLADGVTPNSAAVRFNLDTRSRTLNNNQEFYNLITRGTFDPATGFTDIGGLGAALPFGIRDADFNGQLIEPFDAFRIEVFLNTELTDASPLVIDVNPGEGVDPLTLYGVEGVIPEDSIVIGEGARVTISTGAVGINNPPVLNTTPLQKSATEDDNPFSIDLLEDADDVDGDTLSVTGFSIRSGNVAGVSLSGNSLNVTPSAYNALKVGETSVIIADYTVTDGNANAPAQELTLTITGVNDAPDAGANISTVNDEFDASFNIDLLQNATDPDGDTLTISNITQVGSDDTSGVTPDAANNQLVVNPSAYAALEQGEFVEVTYQFEVSDGNGGTDTATVTVRINGDTPNRAPIATAPITLTVSEDDDATTLDLLTNVTDEDPEDTLSVDAGSIVTTGNTAGFSVSGNSLSINPAAYNSLADGDTEVVTYTYTVVDGEGGSVSQSATITINGANDAPVVSAAVTTTVTEDDNSTNVDLLAGASDPDNGDTVSVDALTLRSGDASGISTNGASGLTIDPSAYNNLAVGESAVIIYDYNLVDQNDAVTPQSATITITGVNDAPAVDNPITLTVTEDDSAQSIDLLAGADDVDTNDTLIAESLTFTGVSTPFTLVNDNTLTFDPGFFNGLGATETEEVVVNYNVADGNGGVAAQTATITINGVNDAPVISGPISRTFSEDAGTQTVSLLDNVTDADTNDVLSVSGVNVTGDNSGITRNGASLSINTGAYSDLEEGESVEVVFTYQVTDGTETLNHSATITITGGADTPIPGADIEVSFNENSPNTTVNLLEGSTDPNDDPLSVINAVITSGDARGVTLDVANNQLLISPTAYADLEDGEFAVVVVDYEVSDDNGNSAPRKATVTIVGQTIVGSTISGQLFVDHIENREEVLNGAQPIRDGVKDADEPALAGVTIRLLEVTSSGETEVASMLTDMDGSYSFDNIFPGTYVVEYDIPDSVVHTGSTRGQIVIGEAGGQTESGPALGAIGLTGVQQRLDLLAKSYIAAGIIDTGGSPEGLAGGSVHLNEDGTQQMFVAGVGFAPQFAEVVLNDARDAALLTIIDAADGKMKSARLTLDQFVVTGDGRGVRFFGNMSHFSFTETNEALIRQEFEDYRNAIDKVMGSGN